MKIRLQAGPLCAYLLVAEDGRSVLVQTDWNFPGVASEFGWQSCWCGWTDGTVDCEHKTAGEMIADNLGKSVEGSGYFE